MSRLRVSEHSTSSPLPSVHAVAVHCFRFFSESERQEQHANSECPRYSFSSKDCAVCFGPRRAPPTYHPPGGLYLGQVLAPGTGLRPPLARGLARIFASLQLPQIVVIGAENAGKSATLERLAGVAVLDGAPGWSACGLSGNQTAPPPG